MATGKYSLSICDRCGFTYKYMEMKDEPGTGVRVCPECNDGRWNLATSPLNDVPNVDDDESLMEPRPDSYMVSAVPTSAWSSQLGWAI